LFLSGVTDVIAWGMERRATGLFNHKNINIFVGVPLKSPKILASDLLSNALEAGVNYFDY